MTRCLVYLCLIVVSTFSFPGQSSGQDFDELNLIQLERQLNAILRTRLPEEKVYIAALLKLVNDNKLPRKLINTSFKYVRNKRLNSKYSFVYFVRVLQFQAKRDRISVPDFDFTIYSRRR